MRDVKLSRALTVASLLLSTALPFHLVHADPQCSRKPILERVRDFFRGENRRSIGEQHPISNLAPAEGRRLLNEANIDSGWNREDLLDDLESMGAIPAHRTVIRGVTFDFTPPLVGDSGRRYVLAVVSTPDGQKNLRIYYESNSQGGYRWLPMLGVEGVFDKGPGENFIMVPPELERTLVERFSSAARVRRVNEEQLWLAVPSLKQPHHYLGASRRIREVGDRIQYVHIKTIGQQPDFAAGPIESYPVRHRLAGEITASVYRSRDGSLRYLVYRDSENRIWFGRIDVANAPLNEFGIATQAVEADHLMAPLWEYSHQVELGPQVPRRHPTLPKYELNWNYLRRFPEIQAWYRATGTPMPPRLE